MFPFSFNLGTTSPLLSFNITVESKGYSEKESSAPYISGTGVGLAGSKTSFASNRSESISGL